jgi:DNA topoisomerase IV subunit A
MANNIDIAESVVKTPMEEFLHENYIVYTYYVIQDRALTKSDGLKPVQRRILYSMFQNGLTSNKQHMKAAKVAANVMGDYHPHGNTSIEDALARMGQKHNMRIPLIGVKGTVGSWPGDTPAAARYWEAKLTKEAELLVEDVFDGSVNMINNFDGTKLEPTILPVRWPNAIINGTEGLAVGYSSYMFPHNPTEVMNACIALAKNREMEDKKILKYIKGPDFPTGGEVIGQDGIEDYILNGRGKVFVRGKYEINPQNRGRNQIIFYELPYKISASDVENSIRKNQKDKDRFKEISEIKNLSDLKKGLRLSITVKSGGNVEKVLEDIFQYTPAEKSFSARNIILIDNKPQTASMKELLEDFLIHREDCIINQSYFNLEKIKKEIHKLEGLLKVLVDIDTAISIIRKSDNADSAKKSLIKKFKIDDEQANHILNMALRRLTKQDSNEIEEKRDNLKEEEERLKRIINDPEYLKEILVEELEETKKAISDKRRTDIEKRTIEQLKEEKKMKKKLGKELSKDIPVRVSVNSNNGLQIILDEDKELENSYINTTSQGNLMALNKNGGLIEVPVKGISTDSTDESYQSYLGFGKEKLTKDDKGLLAITDKGNITIIKSDLKPTDVAIKLNDNENIIYAKFLTNQEYENEEIIMVNEIGKCIRFAATDINGYNLGAGTISGMNTKDDVIYATSFSKDNSIAPVELNTTNLKINVSPVELRTQSRGGKGVNAYKITKKKQK